MVPVVAIFPVNDHRVDGLLCTGTQVVMERGHLPVGLVYERGLVRVLKQNLLGVCLDLDLVAFFKTLLMAGTFLVESDVGPSS